MQRRNDFAPPELRSAWIFSIGAAFVVEKSGFAFDNGGARA